MQFAHMFRYAAGGTGTFSITRGNLLNTLLCGTSVAPAQAARLISGVKLNQIEVRTLTASSDVTSATISIEWTSTLGPSSEVSDTGTPLHPPFLHTSPPRSSLASFWSLTGSQESDVLMLLTVTQNSVIDVWFSYVLQDGQTPVIVSFAGTSVVGQVYAGFLDGQGAGAKLQPISYTNSN